MSRQLLRAAALKAGISEAQADTFVRAIIDPSGLMADVGREFRVMGSFANTEQPYLQGLTHGEWDVTEAAFRWRYMCVALLAGGNHPGAWAHKQTPPRHPDMAERLVYLEAELNKIGEPLNLDNGTTLHTNSAA